MVLKFTQPFGQSPSQLHTGPPWPSQSLQQSEPTPAQEKIPVNRLATMTDRANAIMTLPHLLKFIAFLLLIIPILWPSALKYIEVDCHQPSYYLPDRCSPLTSINECVDHVCHSFLGFQRSLSLFDIYYLVVLIKYDS